LLVVPVPLEAEAERLLEFQSLGKIVRSSSQKMKMCVTHIIFNNLQTKVSYKDKYKRILIASIL
jgi:hypothetical protein